MTTAAFPVKVLNYLFSVNAKNRVVAHCLNFDLVATANDSEEAEHRLDLLVRYHLASYMTTNGASGIDEPAPSAYWDNYKAALREGRVVEAAALRITLPELSPIKMCEKELPVLAARAAAA